MLHVLSDVPKVIETSPYKVGLVIRRMFGWHTARHLKYGSTDKNRVWTSKCGEEGEQPSTLTGTCWQRNCAGVTLAGFGLNACGVSNSLAIGHFPNYQCANVLRDSRKGNENDQRACSWKSHTEENSDS